MKWMILGFLFVLALVVACAPEDINDGLYPIDGDVEEIDLCIAMGGSWREFPNACADFCFAAREEDPMCAQVITESCDCGPNMCWTGTTCVPI